MKRNLFKILVLILSVCLLVNACLFGVAFADSKESIAQKTSEALLKSGRFEIEIQVPGEDGKEYHDEVIIMIDGSYSTDDDWEITKNAIIEIGKAVLEGKGNTLLTVMTFGMGDNVVVEHVANVSELKNTLPELPGGLLYGRSSTNCEAGFTGIERYVDAHDNTLNKVHVIYITDGEINTDENEYVFYDWQKNTWLKYKPNVLIQMSIGAECEYATLGTKLSEAYVNVFGKDILSSEEIETISEENLMKWSEQVWKDVYSYSGLNPERAYPVSVVERAFVKYDKEHDTHIQEMWYYSLWGRKYPDSYTRTPVAGVKMAKHDKIAHLYMVDSNKSTSWMSSMSNETDKVSFYVSGSMSNLIETLSGVLTNLSYLPYNDVVVTDYMSKWVTLDESTLKIIDNQTGNVIWSSADGWYISENKPTNKLIPVVVEMVPASDYTSGGPDVEGNSNGEIYKLTWYVKNGPMLRNNNYSLVYEVDVDVEENNFQSGKLYPSNGDTIIEYTEKDGDEEIEKEEDIKVPDVVASTPTPVPTATPTVEPTPSPTPVPTPTSTPFEELPEIDLPQTGDDTNLALLTILFVISLAGLIVLTNMKKSNI